MTEAVTAILLLVVMLGLGVTMHQLQSPTNDLDELRDYQELRAAGSFMSLRRFHAIREQNRKEREQFGDGDHAPYWPKHKWNGNSTLHRGVWVDDTVRVPSNRDLDAFREAYKRSVRIVKFTLVEGEQDAPMGKNGAWIRVRATAGPPGEHYDADGRLLNYIPSVSVGPVTFDPEHGWAGSSFSGSLPCEMSITLKSVQ